MARIASSAVVYALGVFLVGFALGTVRVLLVVPRLGETAAVAIELPIMVTVSFFFARWAVKRWQIAALVAHRLAMGGIAFAVLMGFETLVSLWLFGNSWPEHLAHYARPQVWLGLTGQVVFAAMPLLLLRLSRR